MRSAGILARGAIPSGAGEIGVALLKPLSYVNQSGPVVRAVREHLGLTPQSVLIVYDDLDLPLGQIRLRERGGSGGHKGMEAILESLRTQEVPRLRVGIGRPSGEDPVDYVLSSFSNEERAALDELTPLAVAALERVVSAGIRAAMNEFNA
jgi:PTH1 family peptidyl-tRNA hydrolase